MDGASSHFSNFICISSLKSKPRSKLYSNNQMRERDGDIVYVNLVWSAIENLFIAFCLCCSFSRARSDKFCCSSWFSCSNFCVLVLVAVKAVSGS
jgi:hypothetical protein